MRARAVLGLSAAGFHRMAYTEWGAPQAERVAVCVHGLTRNGRDFDRLAARLAEAGWRGVCPDVVGRGRSDWLADPAGYGYPQYLADMTVLIARLDVEAVDWIGTSMGGLIGMLMAAQAQTPVRRLVVNDVGPFIPKASLERIASYVGADPRFADLAAAEAYFRKVHAPFGDLSDDDWCRVTESSVRPAEGGGLRPRYDPRIAAPFKKGPIEDVDLWAIWDRIRCPVLVLRGAESDLLLPETAAEMTRRGPRAELVEIPGCGHAPALLDDRQTGLIRDWLLRG
ncbi:MAG: alpha/beta fold hydrolase [Kiloniellaceae bacterium]